MLVIHKPFFIQGSIWSKLNKQKIPIPVFKLLACTQEWLWMGGLLNGSNKQFYQNQSDETEGENKVRKCLQLFQMSQIKKERVQRQSNRDSNSTEETIENEKESNVSDRSSKMYRKTLFTKGLLNQNKRANKKAVNWIQTQCWAHKMSMCSTTLALTLYYCYVSNKQVNKYCLQPLLLACIFMSSKFYGDNLSSLKAVFGLTSKQYSLSTLSKLELQILELTGFNIFFPSVLDMVNVTEASQENSQLLFCIELLLLKDHDILFNEDKLKELQTLFVGRDMQVVLQLRELLEWPQSGFLLDKYHGQFNVEKFIKLL